MMIDIETEAAASCCPPAPTTLEAAGLTLDLVVQLALKTLSVTGEATGGEIARRLGVAFSIAEPALASLRSLRFCEIVRGGLIGGPSYRYRMTDAGRVRAGILLDQSRYVGEAPVPLEQYRKHMDGLAEHPRLRVTRKRLRDALSHLVVGDNVLDQLGPAAAAGTALLIYGQPGNGKSAISRALRDLADGPIAIPRAIEVEGHLIRIFDPVNHDSLEPPIDRDRLDDPLPFDARWVPCRRPLIVVGGELKLTALDLRFSPGTGLYQAPIQTIAGGGVLVIDDFGRQACPPRDLLNRWIVPLESHVDYLTLQSGLKISLPFTTFVIFATNLPPSELADEAFLRRIPYKLRIPSPTPEQFIRVFENCCRNNSLPFDRRLVERLLEAGFAAKHRPLRGCHPRDLIQQALSLAAYREGPRALTLDLLLAACDSYFVDDASDLS